MWAFFGEWEAAWYVQISTNRKLTFGLAGGGVVSCRVEGWIGPQGKASNLKNISAWSSLVWFWIKHTEQKQFRAGKSSFS